MIRLLVLCFVLCIACTFDARAQADPMMFIRADTVANECKGRCMTSYGPIQKVTTTVSNRYMTLGALPRPSDPTDLCSLAVSFRTRTCTIGGVAYTDVVIVGVCSSCVLSEQEMLEKIMLRGLVPDNVLAIYNPSVALQFISWILPPCWTRLSCAVVSPSATWYCYGACECIDAFTGANTMELYCRECCIVRIKRYFNGSCELVTVHEYQGTRNIDCGKLWYSNAMWPNLPITGSFSCQTLNPCRQFCPELDQRLILTIPTAP